MHLLACGKCQNAAIWLLVHQLLTTFSPSDRAACTEQDCTLWADVWLLSGNDYQCE